MPGTDPVLRLIEFPGMELNDSLEFNELLRKKSIDPAKVLVLRHSPSNEEAKLREFLPYLASAEPILFNAYQQTQGEKVEKAMTRASHVASFIGHETGKAVFVGLYAVKGWKEIRIDQFWKMPVYRKLKAYGMTGCIRPKTLLFELVLTDVFAQWKGKLIIDWRGHALAWWRWAGQNVMPVHAIREESALNRKMPGWDEIDLGHQDLKELLPSWRSKLSEWRAIYYIFDVSDSKGYVGSAYGKENLLSRWEEYAKTGHGGNKLLRSRDPTNFRFTILEQLKSGQDRDEVIERERIWKRKLHTRHPHGLNQN